jgi:hypothetical protein
MSKSALRPHRLQDLSTTSLIRALEANINAQIPLMYADMPRVEIFAKPGLLGMMTDLPDPMLNAVYQATFPPEQVEVRSGVERVLHRYGSRGCLPMTWFVTPSTQPGDLGRGIWRCTSSSTSAERPVWPPTCGPWRSGPLPLAW